MDQINSKHTMPDVDNDPLQLLHLTDAETAVLNALLEKGSQSVSKLSRTADIPRTTVFSVLGRLRDRGLVLRKSKGYSSVWMLVPEHEIKQEFGTSLDYINRDMTAMELERSLGAKTVENKSFFTFTGSSNVFHVYQWFMLNHFNQSIVRIHSYIAAASLFGRLHPKEVVQLSQFIKDSRITMQLVMSDRAKLLYETAAHRTPFSALSELMAHAGVVPAAMLPFHEDLFIGNDVALCIDWKACELILIKHPTTVNFLKNHAHQLRSSINANEGRLMQDSGN